MIRFIDRNEELRLLEEDWKRQENAFIVVYGRRRIGKTALVNTFLKTKDGVKYTAEDANKKVQIRELKDILARYFSDEFLARQSIEDWAALFAYLAKTLPRERKIYLWIDEFSYLIKNDSTITSTLQKFIDEVVRNSKLFLIVSGSLFGLMSERILSHASPLYGRRTRELLLKQIPSAYTKEFLSMNSEDALKTTLTVGGIPEYLLSAAKYKQYEAFIQKEFLKRDGYFFREPFFLLSQEFKEIKTYFSILNAIAYGNTKPTEIANFVGIQTREIYPYLELLISTGLIKRITSISGERKRGVYLIDDAFIDFWFNFVHKGRERIENDAYTLSKEELKSFLGKRFEMFIRDNCQLFFDAYPSSGRWWHQDKEIDIVALNEETKEILFGECKWSDKIDAERICSELNAKTHYVNWNNEKRTEHFVIFAKSFKKKISSWEGRKVQCFDLEDIETVLKKK